MAVKKEKKLTILVANGVNLDLLGQREAAHYGRFDLAQLEQSLRSFATSLGEAWKVSLNLDFRQTNDESVYLSWLDDPWDGALLNPGAWTHTSLAIGDRLAALAKPIAEVHISNVKTREAFRQVSYISPHAAGIVSGFGMASYHSALTGLVLNVLVPAR